MRDRRVDLWSFYFLSLSLFFFNLHIIYCISLLLTPEGLRGDFDLNRKSRVVRLRISSSLNSAGKTLELCLDSQAGFTGASFSQKSWFDLKGAAVFAFGELRVRHQPRRDQLQNEWMTSFHVNKRN